MDFVSLNLNDLATDTDDLPEAQAKALLEDLRWRDRLLDELEHETEDDLTEEARAQLEEF